MSEVSDERRSIHAPLMVRQEGPTWKTILSFTHTRDCFTCQRVGIIALVPKNETKIHEKIPIMC